MDNIFGRNKNIKTKQKTTSHNADSTIPLIQSYKDALVCFMWADMRVYQVLDERRQWYSTQGLGSARLGSACMHNERKTYLVGMVIYLKTNRIAVYPVSIECTLHSYSPSFSCYIATLACYSLSLGGGRAWRHAYLSHYRSLAMTYRCIYELSATCMGRNASFAVSASRDLCMECDHVYSAWSRDTWQWTAAAAPLCGVWCTTWTVHTLFLLSRHMIAIDDKRH